MIDHKIFRKMHDNATTFQFNEPRTIHRHDSLPPFVEPSQEPSDLIYLLMQPDIHGFYLTEKKWSEFISLFDEHRD